MPIPQGRVTSQVGYQPTPFGVLGVDAGFFFEAGNAAFEDAQHLQHGIVLTLVFSLHLVEPPVGFGLQRIAS